MQTSSAPLTRSSHRPRLRWTTIVFLFVIVVFGVTVIGHMPKWPIYVTILVWWAFFIYTTIHINYQKDASISRDEVPSRYISQS